MKKYIVLLGVIVSGLVHAAAEQDKPEVEKENCVQLAENIRKEIIGRSVAVKRHELAIGYGGQLSLGRWRYSFNCTQLWLWSYERNAFDHAKKTAEIAEGSLATLEFCVRKSPEYAQNVSVVETKSLLQGLSVKRWQQCLQAHNEAVAVENAEIMRKREA